MNTLLFPLSRNKFITFLLIVMSAGLIVGQMFLTDADPVFLWSNWIIGGIISLSLWYIIGRFHLGGVSDGKSLAIAWPLMSITQNFAYLYFAPSYPFYLGVLQLIALLGIITLILSTWQEQHSSLSNISIGVFIGLSAIFFPNSILWLLLVPFITFHMRSANTRNVFCILTGSLLGIWIGYFLFFIIVSPDTADAVLQRFISIFDLSDYTEILNNYTLWQWLYISLFALMVIMYSISAMVIGTGHSVRASASIMLLSTLSIAEVLFMAIDLSHASLHLCQLALFLCIQLAIHQANLRSSANEWWTIFIILLSLIISLLPLVL